MALEAHGSVTADAPQKPALRHVSKNTFKFFYFGDIDVLFSLSTPALFSFSVLVAG